MILFCSKLQRVPMELGLERLVVAHTGLATFFAVTVTVTAGEVLYTKQLKFLIEFLTKWVGFDFNSFEWGFICQR
jgi:hypothetical protein